MARSVPLHPFTVLSVALAVVVVTTAAGRWWLSCLVVVGCVAVAARQRCAGRLLGLSAAILLPLIVSLCLIHGLVPDGSPALARFWVLQLGAQGLHTALLLGLRAGVLVVAGLLCMLVIDRHQLVAAVDLSRMPAPAGYLLAATLWLLPQLRQRQQAIAQAQDLRLDRRGRGPLAWLRRARLQAVPLVLASVQESTQRSVHLAARGFPPAGGRTRLRPVPDGPAQRRVRRAALIATVLGPALVLGLDWWVAR